jgi:hypothetical protein
MRSLHSAALAVLFTAVLVTLGGCAGGNFGEMITSGPGGLCGLIILIADIFAFVQIAKSSADGVTKVLWALLVFFFPVGGLLIWYFAGPKA